MRIELHGVPGGLLIEIAAWRSPEACAALTVPVRFGAVSKRVAITHAEGCPADDRCLVHRPDGADSYGVEPEDVRTLDRVLDEWRRLLVDG